MIAHKYKISTASQIASGLAAVLASEVSETQARLGAQTRVALD
jgi:hypothetical protein